MSDSKMVKSTDWKKSISQSLKLRNKKERHEFADLIESQNKLFEQVASLKTRNMQLTVETERLKADNLSLQIRADSGGEGGSPGGNVKVALLEQRLWKLSEELTEMHRRRGENAQQIIDLTAAMKEKEKQLQAKDSKLMDALAVENSLQAEIKHLERTIGELKETNQTVKDEHQALQVLFEDLTEKHCKLQRDKDELTARLVQQQMEQADILNRELANFIEERQLRLQEELAEAAQANVMVSEGDRTSRRFPQICLRATIPTKAQCKLDAHDGEVNAVLWSPTGSTFATGSGGVDGTIKLWNYYAGQCTCKGILTGSNAGITSLEYDPEENYILGASNDNACRLWSIDTQRLWLTLTGHMRRVSSAKFLRENSKVVSGSYDRTLKIWDLHTKACIKTILAESSCHDLVTLHGTHIISGHFDKRVRFWDTKSDNKSNEIELHGKITSLALSPDHTSLLVCTREDTLKVIDLRQNQVMYTLCDDNFKVGYDWSRAVFSPDGMYACAGSSDGTLFIWNIARGKVEKTLKEHTHSILACSWHPAGSYILSSEKQKKVVLWSDI
ncbi:autophagy-related protein 16-1-like [Mya arenaria]|uniref:autophagy-related protein 16-1-like n=1 Tax=Mya arenaria TaxID=6604 RepID=UPI0022DFA6CF|nr:autophagy-related protein 16-1-like [Mya arenaria]